ncbi:CaiB/BaiF CoA transferase family protein [Bogoriella caseilytica]|uniref:Crotonobetainyl-CoA:carnitine CoA-transferase CaiB-like acyl-CoA transferase n=1 Tax=Bogoriella caseilytica TaxID=56055 RepID=A0A3N2BDH1_9MICO|nr:CoA transferase [Bogoriella caseilytica]ROR73275.1 crotonobetainyl-CoA:carnitine CoA-transferase CaiB-like acyl-CoA transferase [Bogoriella caseilytica]
MAADLTDLDALAAQATGPLAGVVVADLSRVLAGPYCTMMLADLGALVIKVESPRGDDTRTWVPPERDGEGTYFLSVNRNKHSIALDFSDEGDLALAHRIVRRADVLVENFKPGGLARFGLDYATLSAERADLVYASITGFGTAEGVDLPGYDLVAQAVSGLMDLTGQPDGEPTKVGVALVDVITGLHCLTGILAALHRRSATGLGDHLQVDLLSSALSGLVNQSAAAVMAGVTPSRMGNAHPSLYPYEPFPTADKDLIIAVGNDRQFVRLCELLEVPELATDERFATMGARNRHRDTLRPLLAARLAARGAMDWFDRFRAAGVPSAPILTVAEGVDFAADLGLEPVAVAGNGERRIPTVRHPVRFDSSEVDYHQAPPRLDADRDRVLRWLGAETH